ncbi:MAG TPA: AMP-binding protein, partial [Prolixibacteraceae bacterium]|nr:AMP-binding protein [Prolixibacteraceae bacterium]
MEHKSLATLYTNSFRNNWDLPLFSDYEGDAFSYRDVAQSIHTLNLVFEKVGLKKGDKVAIYGRNSSNWGKIFLACLSSGVVAVPILPDFKPENAHNIVNHSGSIFLFAAKSLYDSLDQSQMPDLTGSIAIDDYSILYCKDEKLKKISEDGLAMMKTSDVKKEAFSFAETGMEDVQIISYTSGSSGFSKGVMIPVRSLLSNLIFAQENMPIKAADTIVSFLPMAHVFGLLFEFMFPVTMGCHITFLNKMPSPQVLVKSFQTIRPRLILSVPLVIEKIYKKNILPTIQKPVINALLKVPGINKVLQNKIKDKVVETFGANFLEIVIGGAALNHEVEKFFFKIKFPFTIGYGMTECGPLISYANWKITRPGSAGRLVDRLEIRIDSD